MADATLPLPADGETEDAETLRRFYIKHEASVRALGTLFYSMAGILIIASIIAVVDSPSKSIGRNQILGAAAMGTVIAGMLALGHGLYKLTRWGRILGITISVLGLLIFPIGTVICGFTLYLLSSEKGGAIFRPEYKSIIASTPHVKNTTPPAVWGIIGFILLLFLVFFLLNLTPPRD